MRLATQVTNRPNRLVRQAGPIHPSLENQRQITLPLAQRSRMSSKNAVRPGRSALDRQAAASAPQARARAQQMTLVRINSIVGHSSPRTGPESGHSGWPRKRSPPPPGPVGPPAGQLGGVCHDGFQGGGQAGPVPVVHQAAHVVGGGSQCRGCPPPGWPAPGCRRPGTPAAAGLRSRSQRGRG